MRTYKLDKSTFRIVLSKKLKHPVAAARSPANLWRTTNVTTGTRYTIYLNFLAFPLRTSPAVAIYNSLSLRLPIHSHHIQPSLKTHIQQTLSLDIHLHVWETRISLFHLRFSLSYSLSLCEYTFISFQTPLVAATRGSTHPSDNCFAFYHPFRARCSHSAYSKVGTSCQVFSDSGSYPIGHPSLCTNNNQDKQDYIPYSHENILTFKINFVCWFWIWVEKFVSTYGLKKSVKNGL